MESDGVRGPFDAIEKQGILLGLSLFFLFLLLTPLSSPLSTTDHGQQWVAGRVFLDGENPYDKQQFDRIAEYEGVLVRGSVFHFFHPPNVLVLNSFLATADYPRSRLLVQSLNVLAALLLFLSLGVLVSALARGSLLPGACLGLYFVLFVPLHHCISSGARGLLVAGLFMGFLFGLSRRNDWLNLTAGILLSFSLLKPNLFLLSLLAFGWYSLTQFSRFRMTLAGFVAGSLAQVFFLALVRPAIFSEYLASDQSGARLFLTPTAGGLVVSLFDTNEIIFRFVPIVFGGLVTLLLIRTVLRDRSPAEVIAVMAMPSLLLSPYAWSYDFVIIAAPAGVVLWRILETWSERAAFFYLSLLYGTNLLLFRGTGSMFGELWYLAATFGVIMISYLILVAHERGDRRQIS